jgi:hypothetical protein
MVSVSYSIGSSHAEATTVLTSDLVSQYLLDNQHSTTVWCYQESTTSLDVIARNLEKFSLEGYETLFIDMPFQVQSFVDGYVSGDISWNEMLENAKFVLTPSHTTDSLEALKPLIDASIETDFTIIFMNNRFVGQSLYLTYPEIPREHNQDEFMFDYWSSNYRSSSRGLIVVALDHCTTGALISQGEFFALSGNGSFEPVEYTQESDIQLFVKNKGLGEESFLSQIREEIDANVIVSHSDDMRESLHIEGEYIEFDSNSITSTE